MRSAWNRIPLLGLLVLGTACFPESSPQEPPAQDAGAGGPAECSQAELGLLYEHYVEPFVSGMVPSSCSQCHMTGIDISIYAQDTPCQTMACMVKSGVADLEEPENSGLLSQILEGDPASSVFSVDAEHAAILEWIQWASRCQETVCGPVDSPCDSGTGAPTTGRVPTGTCEETDLVAQFWDSVVIDQGRCISCHGNSEAAPAFLEGMDGVNDWDDQEHRRRATNAMYALITMGLIDAEEPLNSLLLTKPLLHNFQPKAVYGALTPIPSVAEGVGVGVHHGGAPKFQFECPGFDCSDGAIVDCRTETVCAADGDCGADQRCNEGFCRIRESVCDATYVRYLSFVQAYLACQD